MWHWKYVFKVVMNNKKNPEQISLGSFNYLLNWGRVTSEGQSCRTYRTVGQKLTRFDLNFSRQTGCPEQFFSNLGPTKRLKIDRHHYLISLLKLVVVCNLRFLFIFDYIIKCWLHIVDFMVTHNTLRAGGVPVLR